MTTNKFNPPEEKVYDLTEGLEEAGGFKKVLLLEDDEQMAQILKEILEAQAYQVVAVQSGVEGLKEVMASDFDVILCDMLMPTVPGDMFYLAVERTKPHLCKRFIFITGHRGDTKVDEFIRKVRGVMLWKPFPMSTLLETMQTVLNK